MWTISKKSRIFLCRRSNPVVQAAMGDVVFIHKTRKFSTSLFFIDKFWGSRSFHFIEYGGAHLVPITLGKSVLVTKYPYNQPLIELMKTLGGIERFIRAFRRWLRATL